MRLLRQKALLLVLVSDIACRDSTGPQTISAFFSLQSIDGRPLPTFIAETPGPTATIISSILRLDKTGQAVVIEHRNETFRGDVTDTTTYGYSIKGSQIQMGSMCLAIGTCPTVKTGIISPIGLSLVINPTSTDYHIVFTYRRIASDPVN
ncbi:MAG TPA: hypothetical protein VIM21_12740 [Gemmatimonadaceae bacterium]